MAGDPWPERFKSKMVTFVRSKQDPDGYFRHGIPCIDNDPRLVGRNLSVAKRILAALEVEPVYPFPSTPENSPLSGAGFF